MAQLPTARPRMEAVLRHPLWWTAEERVHFLCKLSRFLKRQHGLVARLNDRGEEILGEEGAALRPSAGRRIRCTIGWPAVDWGGSMWCAHCGAQ